MSRDIFEECLRGGAAAVAQLVVDRTQETVNLDFKAKRDRSHGKMNDDDRRTFANALSAFANSAGGLLVWGIDARKNDDGVDCAMESLPICGLELFRNELIRASAEILQPKHDGIRIEAIISDEGGSQGWVLVWVDRSERRPHRAEVRGARAKTQSGC